MRLLTWILLALLALELSGLAFASQYIEPETGAPMSIPDWFWPAIVTGTVQGLLVFGGIKVKLDWLFARIQALEVAHIAHADLHREDLNKVNERIDRALERRRSTDQER
jgi:lipid-A-disaccharide synthase-like uncharacterized protein